MAHTLQFSDGGLILCWSRIRKFVTYIYTENIQTDRQAEKAITEAALIPWIAGLSGPIIVSGLYSSVGIQGIGVYYIVLYCNYTV